MFKKYLFLEMISFFIFTNILWSQGNIPLYFPNSDLLNDQNNRKDIEQTGNDSKLLINDDGFYDLSKDQNENPIGRWDSWPCIQVAALGNVAYTGWGPNLFILDLNNKQCLGGIELPAYIWDIAISGSIVYLITKDAGLYIFNIQDPDNPIEVGHIDLPDYSSKYASMICIRGNYVFIQTDLIWVLDVSIPENPKLVTVCDDGGYGLAIYQNYLFSFDTSLVLIDISNPENPRTVGRFDEFERPIFTIVGKNAISLTWRAYGLHAEYKFTYLDVINISNPLSPQKIGDCEIAGGWIEEIASSENYIFSAIDDYGFNVIDISDPYNPHEVGGHYANNGWGIDLNDYLVYLAAGWNGFRVFDVSKPESPLWVDYWVMPRPNGGISIINPYAYLTCGELGLWIIDVSNPRNPVTLGKCDTPGDARNVAVSNSYAYIADGNYGIRCIDVSNPTTPHEVGLLDTPSGAKDISISGYLAYIAAGDGLYVIDISDPAHLKQIGFCPPNSNGTNAVTVSNSYAYISNFKPSAPGFQIIDITDPANPYEVVFYKTPATPRDFVVCDSILFVAVEDAGLLAINVSDPMNTREVGKIKMAGAYRIAISGNYAYITNGYQGGVRVINISDLKNLKEIKLYDTPPSAIGIVVLEPYMYVAGDFAGFGLWIFETLSVSVDDKNIKEKHPLTFELMQNYPNPFNSSTIIPFQLQKSSFVTLKIFNLMGQEIQTLVHEEILAGEHKILWTANNLSTGIYLYLLEADEVREAKKLVFQK